MTTDYTLPKSLGIPLLPTDERLVALWRQEAFEILAHNVPDKRAADLQDIIAAIIYTAPHLHNLIKRFAKSHPADIERAAVGDVAPILSDAKQHFCEGMARAYDDDAAMVHLRHYRYRCYLALALAELHGTLAINEQLKQFSDCASFALQQILTYLCARAAIAADAMVVLGMGKLGARELNYSSDIDLIILYDAAVEGVSAEDYVKLTRKLVQIFQKQTGDGFGWRVDLRLRPDPGATAIALSHEAAISYYESIARSWERAIFIRARPVAGNLTLGQDFLSAIEPFIWRRQLDYSILSDLTPWITHYPMSGDGHSYDVKRGAYAIRHIEMMCHLLQILYAGRHKSLRSCHTDEALGALHEAGHLSAQQAQDATTLYWHWRTLEHRLQYCRDAHIYQMPNNAQDFAQFARFAGLQDGAALYRHLIALQQATKRAASHSVIKDMIAAHQGALANGAWPADATSQHQFLVKKGFMRPDDAIRTIESWMSGRLPATRSERARETLALLLPLVITQLAKGERIDDHFMGFAQFLEALPAGVQIFALLNQHPQLIELISNFTLSAPALMRDLTKNPHIFEQMLDEGFFAPLDQHANFTDQLAAEIAGKPAELQLDAIRLFAKEAKFRAEAHIITYPNAAPDAHEYLSDLADACLSASFAITISAFEERYGTIEGSDFAVLLLGRAGQRQLTPQSDIDVIFLYEGDREAQSNGVKQLSCAHYYQRLAQRLISWTNAQTPAGMLYEIDARLRPDGKAGPIATHLAGWQSYLRDTAWPFEKLALQKARALHPKSIYATQNPIRSPLMVRIDETLSQVTNTPIAKDALIKDITLLRGKMASQNPDEWDFKRRKGGLLDCEFLRHLGHDDEAHTEALWHHISLIAAVMMPKSSPNTAPPASLQKELCRIMQQSSFEMAKAALDQRFTAVAQRLDRLLGL